MQEELSDIKRVWNAHRIRPSQQTIGGRPMLIYTMPEIFNSTNYMCAVEQERLDACFQECKFCNISCDESIYQLVNIYMEENGWPLPNDPYEAASLYLSLRLCFRRDL